MKQTQFVNVSLNGMQRVRYEDIAIAQDDWSFMIEELVSQGFKISLRGNPDDGSVSAFVTDTQSTSKNAGYCLSCWGKSIPRLFYDLSIVMALSSERSLRWADIVSSLKDESGSDLKEYKQFVEWKRSQTKDTGS